jgi:hypothetical protein
MSTHVYNAYKFNGTLDALMKHIKSYRKQWIQYQTNRLTSLVLDTRGCGAFKDISEDGKLKFDKLRAIIVAESKKEYKTFGDFYDVSGDVSVFSYRGQLFVQTFLNDRAAPKFINKKFVDFHYQDQADPWFDFDFSEGKITKEQRKAAQKEWKVRENTWKNILGDWDLTPAEAGLTYNLCSGMDFYNIAGSICQVFKEKKLL